MTVISPQRLDEMFIRANLNKEQLHDAFRELGTRLLQKAHFRQKWSPERPSLFQCYVTSELIYWYTLFAERDQLSVRTLSVLEQPGVVHWFLMHKIKGVIDCTADQFDNYSALEYDRSRRTFFLQTGCVGPSSRARLLASTMGFS